MNLEAQQCRDEISDWYFRQQHLSQLEKRKNEVAPALLARVADALRRDIAGQVSDNEWIELADAIDGKKAQEPEPTIYYRGEKSYCLNNETPQSVSQAEHVVLQHFLEANRSLTTAELANDTENPSATVSRLNRKFPGAVQKPAKKGAGYYIRVATA